MTTPNAKNQPAGAIPVYSGAASSAVVTASGQVKSSAGVLSTVAIGVPGTSGSISLYDGTSTSGTLLWTISQTAVAQQDIGIAFSTGLYVSFSAAGATANITYF